MQKLTARQQIILDFIRQTVETQGMPPTRAEIAKAFGFASPNASETHLRALAQRGVITLEAGAARGIRLVEGLGLPLIGRVAAGAPILAQEHIEMRRQIDPAMFTPRADYLLRVRGVSMIDAGIYDGDLLAVHRTTEARDGQIIIARLDDDVTVKRLKRRSNGLIELIAENPDYKSILVDPQRTAFAVEGLAVGLVRDDLI